MGSLLLPSLLLFHDLAVKFKFSITYQRLLFLVGHRNALSLIIFSANNSLGHNRPLTIHLGSLHFVSSLPGTPFSIAASSRVLYRTIPPAVETTTVHLTGLLESGHTFFCSAQVPPSDSLPNSVSLRGLEHRPWAGGLQDEQCPWICSVWC